ncbi:MAG: RNA polymerase sporulation sigma factor SigH [Clostridia bacterium]|nr:RNA polymerase sporulation sigma factor SigH [Clostridia bacterium]
MCPETAVKQQAKEAPILSDETLAIAARAGDSDACEQLVRRYKNFVKIKAKSFFLVGAEHDDVVQEGMVGLYKAIQSFDPEKRVTFKTFAELCITRHIMTAVKASHRRKHIPLSNYVSLNKPDAGSEYLENCQSEKQSLSNPEQLVIDEENVRAARDCMGEVLSPFESKVLAYHLCGFGYSKIAERIGKEPKSVDNALQRIKRKLEKYLRERE